MPSAAGEVPKFTQYIETNHGAANALSLLAEYAAQAGVQDADQCGIQVAFHPDSPNSLLDSARNHSCK